MLFLFLVKTKWRILTYKKKWELLRMYSTTNRMHVNRVKSTSLCLKFVTTVSTEASVFSVIVVFCDAVHLPCSNSHWHFVTDSLVNVASCVSFFLLFSNITLKYCHLPGNEQCWIGPFPTPQNINNNKKNTDCKKKRRVTLFISPPVPSLKVVPWDRGPDGSPQEHNEVQIMSL